MNFVVESSTFLSSSSSSLKFHHHSIWWDYPKVTITHFFIHLFQFGLLDDIVNAKRVNLPYDEWFTLHSSFINSPFINSPLRRVIHPSFTLFRFTLHKDSPFKRVIHPTKSVNGRVNRVNHPSKGEWRFAKYKFLKQNILK